MGKVIGLMVHKQEDDCIVEIGRAEVSGFNLCEGVARHFPYDRYASSLPYC